MVQKERVRQIIHQQPCSSTPALECPTSDGEKMTSRYFCIRGRRKRWTKHVCPDTFFERDCVAESNMNRLLHAQLSSAAV